MIKWLISLFDHQDDEKHRRENVEYKEPEAQSEQIHVNVELDMPDFLNPVQVAEDVVEECSESLLDNKPLVKMFSECADLLKEIDRISPRFKSEDSKILIEMLNERLRTAMYLSGGEPIDKEQKFDPIRHVCHNNLLAEEGCQIVETIEAGVLIGERVFIKAKVRL